MSIKHPPVKVICTFCGWNKVIRPRYLSAEHPKCEQCGCNEMINKPVGALAELVSCVKELAMR